MTTQSIKTKIIFIACCLFICTAQGQIGISTGRYLGKDAASYRARTAAQISLFVPLLHKSIYSTKSGFKVSAKILPSFKLSWYNFKDNLLVSKDSNNTVVSVDPDPNHVYKKGLFRKTSQMYAVSFFMPLTFPVWIKKTKNCLYSPGIWAEYLLGGNFSRKYYIDGQVNRVKSEFKNDPQFYNLNRFQYGICAAFTYKFFTVNTIYSLVPLFNKNSNVSVRKFETKIMFDLFWKKHPFLKFYQP